MQMFFLKNLVGVSIVALVLGGISIATIAEQEETKAPTSELLSPMPKDEGQAEDLASKGEKVYEGMVAEEVNPLLSEMTGPEETPLDRTTERLQALNDADETGNGSSNAMDEPAEPSLPLPDEMAPLPSQEDLASSSPDTQFATPAPGSEAVTSAPDAEAAVNPNASMSPPEAPQQAPEESQITPEATMDLADQEQPLMNDTATSALSHENAALIKPKVLLRPISQNNDNNSPNPAPVNKDDPTDPDSFPDRRGGKRKGAPRFANPKMIPIIRMGENLPQDGGLTVIKAWNH
jgi:hypothetical protein